MTTLVGKYSERMIKQCQSESEASEFRDPRYPLRLRFHKNREKASWYLICHSGGKTTWKRLGYWPILKFDDIKGNLADYITKFNFNQSAVLENIYPNINSLMDWYLKRSKTDTSITPARKTTIKWAITRYIKPLMGELMITAVNREILESKFFWPLQEKLQNSTVRSIWNVLKQVFTQAMFLKLIKTHDLVALKLTHFIKVKIAPEPTKLRASQLGEVDKNAKATRIPTQLLVILMLSHGTRIGETRQLKWSYFCFDSKELNIPGLITKNGDELTIPLTEHIIKLLRQYRSYQKKRYYQGVYLFPNACEGNAISPVTANDMVQEVSLENWTSRSLRKIFRSTLLELGVDSEVAEMMINHRRGTLSETYIHTTVPKLKRQALKKYHAWLLDLQPGILSFSVS